ncbi:MAG: thymidine phosphorylase [Spirochaetaceae bacterium]|nr:MAG: thymidine phosphorylase [Spirochaetaceae bacterium]
MSVLDTIINKRNGKQNSRQEIEELVSGAVDGSVPEYQVSAWLMAAFLNGLSSEETGNLTDVMIKSGRTLDLSGLEGPLVDKHSTGGVGDKVSLILAPMVAACGVQVPMMSGRGLGHTGGTLDKLESIPGYSTALSEEQFREIIRSCGYAMTGQSSDVVPADRLLYALRDVTGTVESIPLITASILSKKFAEGADALVFDVKCGAGAFMKTRDDAGALADSLRNAAATLGRPVITCITRMDAPLGYAIGNAFEVEESVACLQGRRVDDLMEVTIRLGAWMLVAAGVVETVDAGTELCRNAVDDGTALKRFVRNVEAQGGDATRAIEPVARARNEHVLRAGQGGVISGMDAYAFGRAAGALGAGRMRAEDDVLPDVGIILDCKPGDAVKKGDSIARLYAQDASRIQDALKWLQHAVSVSPEGADTPASMILDEVSLQKE